MIYLLASILLSVMLLLNFRLFPRYNVNTVQAISLNYIVCFLTGYVLLPAGISFSLDFGQTWTWVALGIGVAFVITFLLSGASTQRNGITATSLANNLSLVIPVCVSLFILRSGGRPFDALNYLGLVLAVVAVGMSTYRKTEDNGQRTSQTAGRAALLPVAVFLMYGFTNTMINYMNVRYIASGESTPGVDAPGQNPVVVTLTMVVGAIAAGLVLFVYRLVRNKERVEVQNLIGAVTLGVPNFLSFYTLVLALSAYSGNGALVYPLYNIGVILVAAGVAALFFQEKLLLVNKVGLALAVLAIALISWQEFV
ncbi:MAG TPA: EamA/RhaT family transporter [Fibrella sp.]